MSKQTHCKFCKRPYHQCKRDDPCEATLKNREKNQKQKEKRNPQVQPNPNPNVENQQVQEIPQVQPNPNPNVENQQVQENPQVQANPNVENQQVENPQVQANPNVENQQVENPQVQPNGNVSIRPRKRQKREITAESLHSNLIEWEKIPLEPMSKIAIKHAKDVDMKIGEKNKHEKELIVSLYQMGTKKRAYLKKNKLLPSNWNMQTFLKKELETAGVKDVKICGDIAAARTYIELLRTKEYSIDQLPDKCVARQIGTLCGRTNDDDKRDKYQWLDGEWKTQRFLQDHIPAFYEAMSDELEVITSKKVGEYIKEHIKRVMTIPEEIKETEKKIKAQKKKTDESREKTVELEKKLAELKQRSDVEEEEEEEEEEPQREMEMEVEYEN